MWNLLFITTSLGLFVSISAKYPNDCTNRNLNQTIHPASSCVKHEHCPGLHKQGYTNDITDRMTLLLKCGKVGEEICCPHSWMNEDSPAPMDFCGRRMVPASVTNKEANAEQVNFPWMAGVYNIGCGEPFICGGSIISKNHVLTVARCVHGRNTATVFVFLGESDFSEYFGVKKISMYPEYSPATMIKNIAVLTLKREFIFNDKIQPICLPPPEAFPDIVGEEVVVGGLHTKYSPHKKSVIRYIGYPVLETSTCMYQDDDPNDSDEILCARFLSRYGEAFVGIQGSSMMFNRNGVSYLVGIASNRRRHAEKGTPGVYTKISAFVDWIKERMESQDSDSSSFQPCE